MRVPRVPCLHRIAQHERRTLPRRKRLESDQPGERDAVFLDPIGAGIGFHTRGRDAGRPP
jgi:hypothetical protein